VTLRLINPDDLPTPATYTQVVVATGSRLVFVAGQEPEDSGGRPVGPGDLAAQAHQVFANLGRALAAAGARPEQVADRLGGRRPGVLRAHPGPLPHGHRPRRCRYPRTATLGQAVGALS
jgi:hypothetical protein